jgi:hypothetical protein
VSPSARFDSRSAAEEPNAGRARNARGSGGKNAGGRQGDVSVAAAFADVYLGGDHTDEWYFTRPAAAGAPPPAGTREQVESSTGMPLGDVRVHADADAARQTASLDARAFTVGRDVFLGSQGADELLFAHELAHAAQQGARTIPSGVLPVSPPEGGAEREASAAARDSLASRPARISPRGIAVARTPVSDYGAKEPLDITRSDMEKAQAIVPGLKRLAEVYKVVPDVGKRFTTNTEERDAVYDVAWQIRPTKLSGVFEKRVSIPARGSSVAVLYLFTFKPKARGDKAAKDELSIKFEAEGTGAALRTPPTVAGATRPAHLSGSGFHGTTSETYFKQHPDEALQLYGWIAAQKADDGYDQLLVTSETTPKKHESSLRVTKAKGDPEINVDLLGEFRLDEKTPAVDYRRDFAEDLIAKAQEKGDPGQTKKPDKLGAVTGIAGFPQDERFSVRYFAYSLFETTTKAGKTTAGLRDAESKDVVNVAGSKKQVLVRVTIAPTARKGTYDLDVRRIGELGKDAEIDPAKAKPDVGRAAGFPTTGDVKAVTAFIAKRYPALAGVSGKSPAEVRGAANKLLETQAKTPNYFAKNYGVSVLDGKTAAARLQTLFTIPAAQTTDMKNFTDPELWSLELAFETLSDRLVAALAGTAFARQKDEIVDKGAKAKPRFVHSTEHAGLTYGRGVAKDRTVILFDGFHDTERVSFMGTRKEGVLPILDFTILHELGHALDDVTAARAAFNKKFKTLRGFTDYARHDRTKEAFEEAFAIFQGDPEWLETNHKDVFDWFKTLSTTGKAP